MSSVIESIISQIPEKKCEIAWKNYPGIILDLSSGKIALEIGSGRDPIFTQADLKQYKIDFFANDISSSELEKSPVKCKRVVFDICGEVPPELFGHFDVVFSKMVLEHVYSGKMYWINVYNLLKKGGVCLTYHPTLYSPPFVINMLLPEKISATILSFFSPGRNVDERPKFPAKYDFCYSTNFIERQIRQIGYSDVFILPIYYHNYFKKIPVLRSIDEFISTIALKFDIRILSSFAYTLVIK